MRPSSFLALLAAAAAACLALLVCLPPPVTATAAATVTATWYDDGEEEEEDGPEARALTPSPRRRPLAVKAAARAPAFSYSAKVQQELRARLPSTEDTALLALYSKPLIFYTERQVPRSYQLDTGLHDPFYNISARRSEPFGNANREFPWGHPAGTHRCATGEGGVTKFGFVHLPGPIEHWTERMSHSSGPRGGHTTRRWQYPEGTVFGEVLSYKGHVFDLRTRSKVSGRWKPNAYRPLLTREEYDEAALALGADPGRPNVEVLTLKSKHPDRTAFRERAAIDYLSPIPGGVAEKLLKLPFRSAFATPWIISEDGVSGAAPSTRADGLHIVPRDYDGGFVPVDSKSCMRCHEGVKLHADDFDARRDWYGRVRGDDAIFSFNPFDPRSISHNGVSRTPSLDGRLTSAGLLVRWTAGRK